MYVRRTVWNTIDVRYSIWRLKLEYLSSILFHTVLVAREYVKTSKTLATRTVWNTIDDNYSSFALLGKFKKNVTKV